MQEGGQIPIQRAELASVAGGVKPVGRNEIGDLADDRIDGRDLVPSEGSQLGERIERKNRPAGQQLAQGRGGHAAQGLRQGLTPIEQPHDDW